MYSRLDIIPLSNSNIFYQCYLEGITVQHRIFNVSVCHLRLILKQLPMVKRLTNDGKIDAILVQPYLLLNRNKASHHVIHKNSV